MRRHKQATAEIRGTMVCDGKLDAALTSINHDIREHPRDALLYRERAHLFLYLGRAQQSRVVWDRTAHLEAETFHIQPGKLHADGEYTAIGVTYWIEGHTDLALAFWRYTTTALVANRVQYSFMGGGIETGLLLWFGGVCENRPEDVDLVRALNEKRLSSRLWSHHPKSSRGAIVRFFLKKIDEQKLIDAASTSRQELCKAHFAAAVRARERGRYSACRKHSHLAVPDDGPLNVYDYYNVLPYFLARHELRVCRKS